MSAAVAAASDEVLLAAVAIHHHDALVELYRRHAAAVYALARSMLQERRAAEALAGEVFVDLWWHPDEFGANGAPLRAGLLSRTYSKTADRLVPESPASQRPRRNAPARASASTTLLGPDSGYSAGGDLSVLSARDRDVIELACFPGHTYVDVAMLCGLDEAVVKRCIRSGLGRMVDAGRTSRGGGRRGRGVRRQPPRRPA
ncbi:MAG: hypothetical protein ACR2MO_17185 [Acidimicrobiales bacterium]